MNRGIDKSLQIKTGSESARRPRQHNPLPTGEVVCSVFELREEATHLARRQKKAKLPSGKTLTGFTKQFTCSAPEPIFPTGTKAPKLTAAMLRVASTDGDALRFMGTIKGRLRQSSLSMNRAGCGSQTRGPDRASVRRSGSWSQCVRKSERWLSMNHPSPGLWPPSPRLAGRGQGEGCQSSSWSQCIRENERGLPMNQRNIQHRTPNAEHRMASRILAHFGVRCSMLDVRCFPRLRGFNARMFISEISLVQPVYRVQAPLRFLRRPADVRLVPIVFGLGLGTSTSG